MTVDRRPALASRREKRRAFKRRKRDAVRLMGAAVVLLGLIAVFTLSGVSVNKALHQHAQLTITLNGVAQEVPEGIGIEPSLWNDHSLDTFAESSHAAAVHTHLPTGELHVELSTWHPCTLGDFFRIWGQPLSPTECLWFKGPVTVTVNGQETRAFSDLVLQEGQHIEIRGG